LCARVGALGVCTWGCRYEPEGEYGGEGDFEEGGFEEGGDDEDHKVYCVCQRADYGEMIACDNESCPVGEASRIPSPSLRVLSLMPHTQSPQSDGHQQTCTPAYDTHSQPTLESCDQRNAHPDVQRRPPPLPLAHTLLTQLLLLPPRLLAPPRFRLLCKLSACR
jgi:hypothetical protein